MGYSKYTIQYNRLACHLPDHNQLGMFPRGWYNVWEWSGSIMAGFQEDYFFKFGEYSNQGNMGVTSRTLENTLNKRPSDQIRLSSLKVFETGPYLKS